jgi:eukaryotic-like serine/threonine-protein kinase
MRSAGGEVLRGNTSSVLNRGTYLTACGVPETTRVEICRATRDGQLRGLDVVTTPANEGLTECIADRVRSLSFPSTPSLDVSRVVFAEL